MQRDILVYIVVRVKHGGVSYKEAQNMSSQIIEVFKNTTEASLYNALYEIGKKHPGILDIFIKNATAADLKKRTEDIPAIISFIGKKDIKNALRIAKGGEN